MFKIAPMTLLATIVVLAVAMVCQAQTPAHGPTLVPGAKVRLQWSPPDTRQSVGTATEVASAGFLFQPVSGETPARVEFSALNSLEMSTGRRSKWVMGLVVGLNVGAAAGWVLAGNEGDIDPRPFSAAAGGLAGGVLGYIIGQGIRSEQWVSIPLR